VIGGNPIAGEYKSDLTGNTAGKITEFSADVGAPLWQVATGDAPIQLISDNTTIYALLADHTYLRTATQIKHTILALDGATGAERWRVTSEDANLDPTLSGPFTISRAGSTIYFLTEGSLTAYAARDGKRLWRISAPEGNPFTQLAIGS